MFLFTSGSRVVFDAKERPWEQIQGELNPTLVGTCEKEIRYSFVS